MNVKDYIESGILEAYVLDALPADEAAAVQANITLYPELAAEVAAIEAAMHEFAESIAEAPPAHMHDQIWNMLQKDAPSQPVEEVRSATRVIPLSAPPEVRNTGWQRAAVLIALVGSLLANFMLWSQKNTIAEEQASLSQKVESMQQTQQQLAAQISSYQAINDMKADTAMQPVVMQTAQKGHPMAATVYWNKKKGEAYVAMDKLPVPPKGMQYQLWVMQNGKPVDMGTLPNDMVTAAGAPKAQKLATDGQAFAISLEKEGGSLVPTMTNIYVMGKVSS